MRICIVTASASRDSYGVFPVMVGTAHALRDRGHEIVVAAGKDPYSDADAHFWDGVSVQAFPQSPIPRLHYARGFSRWLRQQRFDLVSLQGVWIAMLADGQRYAERSRIPCMLTPHGMLDPWALSQSRAKKSLARLAYADRMLEGVDCLHVFSPSEAEAVRAYGLRQPIAIIPNGVDLPPLGPPRVRGGRARKLLFLGRLHPKKGVRELVSAWNKVGPRAPDWTLQIAGPDEVGMLAELQRGARAENVEFLGPVYGADKDRVLREADAFVLPSYSEGLPMAVLEAWSYELPVVMSRACNIAAGFERGAAMEVETSVESLAHVLAQLSQLPDEALRAVGQRGRALVESEYSWAKVAHDLDLVYEWMRRGGTTPSCVSLG